MIEKTESGYPKRGRLIVAQMLKAARGKMPLRDFYKISGISPTETRRLEAAETKEFDYETLLKIAAITERKFLEIMAILHGEETEFEKRTLSQPEFVALGKKQLSGKEIFQTISDFIAHLKSLYISEHHTKE